MSVALARSPSALDIEDPVMLILSEGTSHTFESKGVIEEFQAAGSTAVTIDLGTQLFREMIEWKNLQVYPSHVQVSEVEEWEKFVEKINALEAVSGLLNELTPEQMQIFEEAVQRRPLFE